MSDDFVRANVERDLMERKARLHRQPTMHPRLPEFDVPRAPAALKKPVKKRSATFYHSLFGEIREAAMKSADPLHADHLLRLMEERGWPTVDTTQIGMPTLARHGAIGGSEAAWETFVTWAEAGQMKGLITQAIHNPTLFVLPTKQSKRGRKSADEDDERYIDALKGEV